MFWITVVENVLDESELTRMHLDKLSDNLEKADRSFEFSGCQNVIYAKGKVLEKHKDAELMSGWMNCLSLHKK